MNANSAAGPGGTDELPRAFERDGYLEIRIKPQDTRPATQQGLVDTIAALAVQHAARRVLVVCEDPESHFDKVDAYWVGDAIARKLSGVRTAVVVLKRPVDYLEDYAARIARTQGAEIRFFEDMDVARRWLMHDAPS